jgi:hypothetical protein
MGDVGQAELSATGSVQVDELPAIGGGKQESRVRDR